MVGVGRQVEVVDGDVAALADVFEGYGASDSCCTACYGSGFGEKEVVRHDK